MAIKIQDIIEKCNFLLDAEDSDHYTFDNDFKQAAKLTQQWLVSLYNKFFGENKISEESLTELVSVKAFWMGSANRVFLPVQNGVLSESISIPGELIVGWNDLSTLYDVFTSSGTRITDCQETAGNIGAAFNGITGGAPTGGFGVLKDEVINITCNVTLNSGTLPWIFLVNGYTGPWGHECSNTVRLTAGANDIDLTATETVEAASYAKGVYVAIYNPSPEVVNFSTTGDIVVKRKVINNDDGTVKICVNALVQGVEMGEYIVIDGTVNYDGLHQIVDINKTFKYDLYNQIIDNDRTYISIPATYVSEVISGTVKTIHKFWTLIGIYPEITTIPVSPSPPSIGETGIWANSVMVNEVLKSCKRLTFEEWAEKQRNPLVPGSELITNSELKEYAYLPAAHYYPGVYSGSLVGLDSVYEYLVMPSCDEKLIGVGFLKKPLGETIVHQTNILPFPESLVELVVEKFLQFISIKEDDRRSLYDISNAEIQKAFLLLS